MLKKFFVLLLFVAILSIPQVNAGTITSNGFFQGDMFKLLRATDYSLKNRFLDSPDVARGVTATENILSATTANYIINGLVYSLGVSSDIDLSSAGGIASIPVQGASISKNYLVFINSAGSIYAKVSSVGTLPDGIAGYAPLAWIQVGTLAGGSYTFGTTKLGATSVNYTVNKIITIPSGNYGVSLTY